MGWVHRDADIHRCAKPASTKGVKTGDIWQCDECLELWRVKRINYDQRDNASWLEWEKYTGPKPERAKAKPATPYPQPPGLPPVLPRPTWRD